MNTIENKRIRQTKENLKKTLIKLLNDKHIDEISIRDLCDEASINRSTFYKHFKDIYSFIQSIEEEVYKSIEEFSVKMHNKSLEEIFTAIYSNILSKKDEYLLLFDAKVYRSISLKAVECFKTTVKTNWKNEFPKFNDLQLDMMFDFVIFGVLGLIEQWVRKGMVESVEIMTKASIVFANPYKIKI